MDEWKDRWMDRGTDGRMNEWINLLEHDCIMVGQTNGQLLQLYLYMDGWINGQMDG